MTISMDKQYRTRDGQEVRIYAVDGAGKTPVHGAIKFKDGWWEVAWKMDGSWGYGEHTHDLIEVKPRIHREYWVNVYSNYISLFNCKEFADDSDDRNNRIACVKVVIDCEEGQGL